MKLSRSAKGLIEGLKLDYKALFTIAIIIALCIELCNIIIYGLLIISSDNYFEINDNTNNVMILTLCISIFILGIQLTSKNNLKSKFAFPVSRKEMTFIQALMMLIGAFVGTILVAISGVLEIGIMKIVGTLANGQIISSQTFSLIEESDTILLSYITVFFVFLLLIAYTYSSFLYMRRWPKVCIPIFVCIAVGLFILVSNENFYDGENVFTFMFMGGAVVSILKNIMWFVILIALSYIPLKSLNVAQ